MTKALTYGDTFNMFGTDWEIRDGRDWQKLDNNRRANIVPVDRDASVKVGRAARAGVTISARHDYGKLRFWATTGWNEASFTETQDNLIDAELDKLTFDLPELTVEERRAGYLDGIEQRARIDAYALRRMLMSPFDHYAPGATDEMITPEVREQAIEAILRGVRETLEDA